MARNERKPIEIERPNGQDRAAPKGKEYPLILHKNSPMRRVTKKSLDAIAKANQPPKLFQQGGVLVRIRRCEDHVFTEPLTIDSLRGHLDRAADFGRVYPRRSKDQDEQPRLEPPPLDFVRDILALPHWDDNVFPYLKGIVTCPFFTATGKLITQAGYDPESQLWYEPEASLEIGQLPDKPTDSDIAESKRWLLEDLLVDFPFQNLADRTNALAYLLTPFVRDMVDGPVPMALLEAPAPGTGKGLLANALAFPSTGQKLETFSQRDGDEEWRKAITAKLLESPTFILLDNLSGTIRSPALDPKQAKVPVGI